MAGVITKAAQGLSRLVKVAKTPQDWEAIVTQVREQLIAKTAELADLEQERESILLEGGDEADFYARLVRAREQVDTLKLNLTDAERRAEKVKAATFIADLEATAQSVRDTHVPGAEQALTDLHLAMVTLTDAAARVKEHTDVIANHDENMRLNQRPDLMVGVAGLMQRVANEIAGETDESDKPVRIGRLDEPEMRLGYELFHSLDAADKPRYERWLAKHGPQQWAAHETDAAYNLRLQSWAAKKTRQAQLDNPFAVQGEKAIAAIESVTRAPGVFEASRGVRRMSVSRYLSPDGSIRKVLPVDGLPSPGSSAPPQMRRAG